MLCLPFKLIKRHLIQISHSEIHVDKPNVQIISFWYECGETLFASYMKFGRSISALCIKGAKQNE